MHTQRDEQFSIPKWTLTLREALAGRRRKCWEKETNREKKSCLNLKIICAIKLMMIMELSKFIILWVSSSASPDFFLFEHQRKNPSEKNEAERRKCMRVKLKRRKEKKGLIFQHTTAVTASVPSRVTMKERGKQITVVDDADTYFSPTTDSRSTHCWWKC